MTTSNQFFQAVASTRTSLVAICVIGLIALLASITLIRMNALYEWNHQFLRNADRLEIAIAPLRTNGPDVADFQTLRDLAVQSQLAPQRCLNELKGPDWQVAQWLGFGEIREYCVGALHAANASVVAIDDLEADRITLEKYTSNVYNAALRMKVLSSRIYPLLSQYSNILGQVFVVGSILVTALLLFLSGRQAAVIRGSAKAAATMNERLDKAVASMSSGFAIFSADGRLVQCNDAYRSFVTPALSWLQPGMLEHDIIFGAVRAGLFADLPPDATDEEVGEYLTGLGDGSVEYLAWSDGRSTKLHFSSLVTGEKVILLSDQTETLQREEEAAHAARTDVLTGLPNRRHFDEVVAVRDLHCNDHTCCTTLIRIDLDNFKHVNDSFGHEAGDLVLQHVGDALRRSVRPADFVARLGGDEFLILPEVGTCKATVQSLIDRFRHEAEKPVWFDGHRCRFGVSFGVASTELAPDSMVELLSFADVALYEAKRKGRGRVEVFTPELLASVKHNRMVADEIRWALERGELVPHLQSQINAKTGDIFGFEVLARWQHPERGLLYPDQFLDVAEKLRIVPDIDRAMFNALFDFVDRLHERRLTVPRLSFNVSAGRLRDTDIVTTARRLIDKGAPVAFEILESVAVEDKALLKELDIEKLRRAGVELELDDFGSGHASIVGVLALAPDGLKIDRRIVQPMLDDANKGTLVKAVIDIAQSLGMHTVAEGVESHAHANALTELGADILQGYAFSRPMPMSKAIELLSDQTKRSAG